MANPFKIFRRSNHDGEKDKVIARLAATDIVAICDATASKAKVANPLSKHDRDKALQRIMDEYGVPEGAEDVGEDILNRIIALLETSELTVNIKTALFDLSTKTIGLEVLNAWQLPGQSRGYLDTRQNAEEQLYSYAQGGLDANTPNGVKDRIRKFGNIDVTVTKDTTGKVTQWDQGNDSFDESMRPKYAAINFLKLPVGGAKMYGPVVLSLKHYVRFNATFTFADSFMTTSSDQVCTYHNLYPLIVDAPSDVFKSLVGMATLDTFAGKTGGYMEAQIHSPVVFARDIDHARIPINTYASLSVQQKDNFNEFFTASGVSVRTIS